MENHLCKFARGLLGKTHGKVRKVIPSRYIADCGKVSFGMVKYVMLIYSICVSSLSPLHLSLQVRIKALATMFN